jgi:hypothetical protein
METGELWTYALGLFTIVFSLLVFLYYKCIAEGTFR